MNRLRGRQTRAQMRELVKLKRTADMKRPHLINAPGDIATRPGAGVINWKLYGRVLMHRQLELDYAATNDDFITALAIEQKVAKELYG